MFLARGMISLLLNWWSYPIWNCWLLTKYMYHYCTQGCSGMMVVVVVHKHHNWVELLVAYLLCKLAQCLLVPWTPVLREGHTGQFWLSCVWIMFLKCIESSSIVTTTWGLTKDHTNRLCVLGIFWTTMTKCCLLDSWKEDFLYLIFRSLLDHLWLLEEELLAQKILFTLYLVVYSLTYVYFRLLMIFFLNLSCYLTLLSFCIYLLVFQNTNHTGERTP